MRILLVSHYFPPFNTVGAIRTGAMARWLSVLGHEVRVLTARDQPLAADLTLPLPSDHVWATSWTNYDRAAQALLGGRESVARTGYRAGDDPRSLAGRMRSWYRALAHWPDGQWGWHAPAVAEGRRRLTTWRPDVIYASSAPVTSLRIARQLADEFRLPWVAEFRDLWVGNHALAPPAWRRWIDAAWEGRLLRTAAGLVTVAEPLATRLRARYPQPVAVIPNGCDPAPAAFSPRAASSGPLRIVYTGSVYAPWQDAGPLFDALAARSHAAAAVRVEFYGRNLGAIESEVRRRNLAGLVSVQPAVSHAAALQLQRDADLLLALLWNDPDEPGVVPVKLFEYLGAGRPVLAVGRGADLAEALIQERRAGWVFRDAASIDAWLGSLLAGRARGETIPALGPEAYRGLTREDRARDLERFLHSVLAGAPVAPHGPHRGVTRTPHRGGRATPAR